MKRMRLQQQAVTDYVLSIIVRGGSSESELPTPLEWDRFGRCIREIE